MFPLSLLCILMGKNFYWVFNKFVEKYLSNYSKELKNESFNLRKF